MEIREYGYILSKNWVPIMVAAILGLGAGGGVSLLMTPDYQSQAQLYVSVRSQDGTTGDLVQGATYSSQIVNSYTSVVQSGVVLDPVVEDLQLDISGAELAEFVEASSPSGSSLINITASSPSPEQAAQIVNAVGESFKEVVRTQLEPETGDGGSPVTLTTTQPGLVPETPVSPNVVRNLILGLVTGLALGYGIAFLRTMVGRRIYSLDDLEETTERPILGRVVKDSSLKHDSMIVNALPHSLCAESFRAFRTNLQFLNVGSDSHIFAVTSSKPDEGKTTVALNLGLALAQAGSRVVVVEADVRRPSFSTHLEIEGAAGLTDVLIGRVALSDVVQRWGENQFYVLPAGQIPPNPSELLGSRQMETTLETLREQYDYVIIDTPPVLAVTDAAVISKNSAGLLMVVSIGSTTQRELENALQTLETAGAPVLGMVATRVPMKKSSNIYAEGYGDHSYGQGMLSEVPTQFEAEQPAAPGKRARKGVHAK